MEDKLMKKKKSKMKVHHFLRDTYFYLTDLDLLWSSCLPKNYHQMDEEYEPFVLADFNAGFIILSHIFQYLKIKDLLMAACVCKAWNYVASRRSLWKVIRMENYQVGDWSSFRAMMIKNETEELDLWGMVIPEDIVHEAIMWRRMSKAVKPLKSLKRLDMGRCPPEGLAMMVKVTTELTSLIALDISLGTLDLVDIGKLNCLTELKLNSFTKNLELKNYLSLKELQQLKILSITEVVTLSGIENCLPPGLENLELGPWQTLSVEMSRTTLPQMTSLRKLRLEQAWESSIEQMRPLFEAISTLPHLTHLELINFPALPGFESLVSKLKNIKIFHYLMNVRIFDSGIMNHVFMGAVSRLRKTLKRLVWELPRDREYTEKNNTKLDIIPLQVTDSGYVDFIAPTDFWWNLKTLLPYTEIEFVNVTVLHANRNTACA